MARVSSHNDASDHPFPLRQGRRQLAVAIPAPPVAATPAPAPVVGEVPRAARLLALAIVFEEIVRTGEVESYAELARRTGVSRARVSQIMGLLNLAPDKVEAMDLPPFPWKMKMA